jgi:plasmid replication initiation protein
VAYQQLQEVGTKLLHRIAQEVTQGPKGRRVKRWQWVSVAEYMDGEGMIRLTFNHEMTPHLVMLKKEFTSYRLQQASALRSLYSWRLFELLMQFKRKGLLRISVVDFCHAVEAPATAQANFGELRRRIIEPAVAELNTKNGFEIDWKATKEGRKVAGLEFTFKPMQKGH